ncbi:radical SAM protein [Roseibacillus ishigakijimensis]|uniref:radical SAM protein n=1 Tax=Roseibacillus ishigakijimensis TaxID=454146 RepID=UPI001F240D10|nr:radical SAM protein [Roseibacillus ishigakijimensis]
MNFSTSLLRDPRELKRTTSRCPDCLQRVPAEVLKISSAEGHSEVHLRRRCPEHGESTSVISSDARFYWLAQGSEDNRCGPGCACTPADSTGLPGTLGKNAGQPDTIEKLSTCLALIEIVDSCNLACPTCFADSPAGTGERLKYHSLAALQQRITGVLDRKGPIELLQLSGGEPTLHPEFFALLDWIHEEPRIDYALINTNGVKLAGDKGFLEELGKRVSRGHLQLYLQFDGPQQEGQVELRGTDLREMKKKALANCEAIGLPVTLAMTVMPENLPHLWETVQFGLGYESCRGVSFQPLFHSGRTHARERRLNTADIILGLMAQSDDQLGPDDFTPLPCGDPNCATIGYLLKTPLGTRSVSEFIDFAKVQGFLQDKIRYHLSDLV